MIMTRLLNTTFIDPGDFSQVQCDIQLQTGMPAVILPPGNRRETDDHVIDCSGMFTMPAFACGHHHVYSALARGMGSPRKSPENFREVLKYVWWTLDKCLDRDMIEASALATAVACAKRGVTFVIDHHASPNAVSGSLDIIAGAFEKIGVGHLLCYEISDRDGRDIALRGLEETDRYLQKRKGLVGLHAGFTVGDETLKQAVELSVKHQTGIHVHTAEDLWDQEFSVSTYGKRVVERFHEAGVMESHAAILVHCLHLDDEERALVSESPCWVAQNSESNQNNRVGLFSCRGLGPRIMLGTDGMHSDMLRSAKAAWLNAPKSDGIGYEDAYRRLRNINTYLENNNFKAPGLFDLVVLDYPSPTPLTRENFAGHFIFGLESAHIRHVVANGELIVNDGRIVKANEAEILEFTRVQAKRLWTAMKKI